MIDSFTFGVCAVIRSRGDFAAAAHLRSDRGRLVAAGGARPWLPGYAVHLASPRARVGAPRISGGGAVAARVRRADRPADQRRDLRSPPARRSSPLRRGRPRDPRRPRLGRASRIRSRRRPNRTHSNALSRLRFRRSPHWPPGCSAMPNSSGRSTSTSSSRSAWRRPCWWRPGSGSRCGPIGRRVTTPATTSPNYGAT